MFCHCQLLGDGGGEKDRPKYHQVNMSHILELLEKKRWKRQPIIKYLNNSNFSAKLIRRLSLRPTPEELEERNVLKSKLFFATLRISSLKTLNLK